MSCYLSERRPTDGLEAEGRQRGGFEGPVADNQPTVRGQIDRPEQAHRRSSSIPDPIRRDLVHGVDRVTFVIRHGEHPGPGPGNPAGPQSHQAHRIDSERCCEISKSKSFGRGLPAESIGGDHDRCG